MNRQQRLGFNPLFKAVQPEEAPHPQVLDSEPAQAQHDKAVDGILGAEQPAPETAPEAQPAHEGASPIAPCGPQSHCKKDKISIEGEMSLAKAVLYLEDLVNNLRAGTLCLYSGEECLVLRPEPTVEFEIKASGKKKKGKLCLKLGWRSPKTKDQD